MNDPHPKSIKVAIDRESLRKYLRRTWLRSWLFGLGFLGAFFGLSSRIGRLEDGDFDGWAHLAYLLISGVVFGILISSCIAFVLYFLLSHFRAKRIAETQSIRVEGAFLQIRQHMGSTKLDRKIHFRAVTDFSVIEDKRMKRYGIKALQMNTTGGSPSGLIRIDGVKDCDRVRDMLAEIDSIRENQIT